MGTNIVNRVLRCTMRAAILGLGLAFAAPQPAARAAEPTLLTVTERAERTLVRDRLDAELAVEASDADVRRLQDEINRRMAAALARAKGVPGMSVATTGYTVYQDRTDKAHPRWRGRQGLHLESGDTGALLQLVGALQEEGLAVSSLSATLSREAARAVEDELTAEALRRIKDRAERIAASLGLRVARYRTLHVGSVAAPPVPFRALGAMVAAAAPPVAEPGEATVGLAVDAEVELASQ